MVQWKQLALAASVCAVLTGCVSGRPKVIGAPQLSIQELQLGEGRSATARVLLQNYSNIEVIFADVDYQLTLGAVNAATGNYVIDLPVAPESSEPLTFKLSLSDAALQQMLRDSAVAYTLSGVARSSSPSRRFEFNYEGRLSPVPGKKGAWR
jgi:LEA14-like dessication related protein